MSIPLVRNNTKDAINTSIIAIKKNLERINSILGLMSGLATKQELENAVTEINDTIDEVETSLQPVDTVTSGNMHSVTSNAVYNELYYTTRAYQVYFATFFTANTTVHIVDFVNAVVNKYGKGFKDLSFIWSNANQGYITDGVTSILMNGNFIRGYFTPIAEGYDWVRCQFLTYNINNGKVYIIEVKRDSSTISEHIYPLN